MLLGVVAACALARDLSVRAFTPRLAETATTKQTSVRRHTTSPMMAIRCLSADHLYMSTFVDTHPEVAKVPLSVSTPVAITRSWTAMRGFPMLRRLRPRLPPLSMVVEPTPSPVSPSLLLADCAALVTVSLLASSLQTLAVAGLDLTSSTFDLATELSSFDLTATAQYIGIEQFCAASPALSWLVGGTASGACGNDWCTNDARTRWRAIALGCAISVPLTLLLKYGVLAFVDLPSLGHSAEAMQLEEQLAGPTVAHMLNDALIMVGSILLWRQVLLRNPHIWF